MKDFAVKAVKKAARESLPVRQMGVKIVPNKKRDMGRKKNTRMWLEA